ncbi:MAG: helix-turn-helix transcriptional regulator [Myxococcaceae bacterium]|nr:helix-turn-helix transcriptional regulator [Myxococcaceae bacterium]
MVTTRNSPAPMEVVAVNVRRLRLAAKLTQAQLAERAGLDRTFVSLCERCHRNVTVQSLFALASGLGCDPQQLVAAPSAGGAVHRPEDARANAQARVQRLGASRSSPGSRQRNGVRR